MKKLLLLIILVAGIMACRKTKNQPEPYICTSKTSYVFKDTITAESCSKNYTKLRWVLPDGTQSTQAKVYYIPPTSGVFTFTLYASNDDYVNEFKVEKQVTVTP